jgi:hypothetical protein
VGVATKRRPALVLGGCLAMSLVLALALVGASRLSAPTIERTPRPASPSDLMAQAPAPPPPVAAPTASPLLIVAASPSPTEKQSGRGAIRVETPLLVAVRHASAGRLAEAAEAYRALGAGTDGGVYAGLAQILARRASAACASDVANQERACPEILK